MTDTVHQAPDEARVAGRTGTARRGTNGSAHLIGQLPDTVVEALTAWQGRPLDAVWPVVFVNEVSVRIGHPSARTRPIYVVGGVDCAGVEQVLGLWPAPDPGESSTFWLDLFERVTARGMSDVCLVSCDWVGGDGVAGDGVSGEGVPGLPDAIGVTWPRAIRQTRVLGLIRASRQYGPRRSWAAVSAALLPVYTAPDEMSAAAALDDFAARFGQRYPALVRLWRVNWAALAPFLALPIGVRQIVFTTPLLDVVDARLRGVVRDHGPFPSTQAAVEAMYLAVRDVEDAGRNRTVVDLEQRRALRAVGTYFDGRIPTR